MSTNFVPANELEKALAAAATDPTERPRFYRTLLESDVFVLVIQDETGTRIQTVGRDQQEIVPIFSSLARLEEFTREVNLQEHQHERGSGREILSILASALVVLNPVSDYGKEFYPPEIEGMLDGSAMKRLKVIVIDESQPALFSQPSTYPQQLVASLKASFAVNRSVRRAYLAQIHQAKHQHPQFVIGIEAEASYQPSAAMEIAVESLGEDEFITFMRLGSDKLSTYLREQTEPLYTRAEDSVAAQSKATTDYSPDKKSAD